MGEDQSISEATIPETGGFWHSQDLVSASPHPGQSRPGPPTFSRMSLDSLVIQRG